MKGVNIKVDTKFYDKLEMERKMFMRKYGLNKLTTKAFTGMLANKKNFGLKNVKKQKR